MPVQARLLQLETQLVTGGFDDAGWDLRQWPDPQINAGMRVHRLWRRLGTTSASEQLMLHRFVPEPGVHEPHAHPMAIAAHVLGPGEYEVGFITDGVCQARLVCAEDFYYEMRTREVRHYVLPRSGPVYSVCLWTPFPPAETVPGAPLSAIGEVPTLPVVQSLFERLWPLGG